MKYYYKTLYKYNITPCFSKAKINIFKFSRDYTLRTILEIEKLNINFSLIFTAGLISLVTSLYLDYLDRTPVDLHTTSSASSARLTIQLTEGSSTTMSRKCYRSSSTGDSEVTVQPDAGLLVQGLRASALELPEPA